MPSGLEAWPAAGSMVGVENGKPFYLLTSAIGHEPDLIVNDIQVHSLYIPDRFRAFPRLDAPDQVSPEQEFTVGIGFRDSRDLKHSDVLPIDMGVAIPG